MKSTIIPTTDSNIDWDEVIKKEARGINDSDFGEVQLTIGDTVITEKGIADKDFHFIFSVNLTGSVHLALNL